LVEVAKRHYPGELRGPAPISKKPRSAYGRVGAPESNCPNGVTRDRQTLGRPSPRKVRDTRKAEQVSWLAAWLTLCAFPSRLRQSGKLAIRQLGGCCVLPSCPVA
jgi:hypothetical protein